MEGSRHGASVTAPTQAGERYVAISAEIDKLSCRYCRDGVPRAKVLSGAWKHEFEGEWLLRCDSISDKVLAALAQFSVTLPEVTTGAQELAAKARDYILLNGSAFAGFRSDLYAKEIDTAISKARKEARLDELRALQLIQRNNGFGMEYTRLLSVIDERVQYLESANPPEGAAGKEKKS